MNSVAQRYFVLFFILLLSTGSGMAQSIITIGTGTNSNNQNQYPAPYGNFYWGAKHQILILASELNAAGMSAGDISSLAFEVTSPNGVQLTNFEIAMKNTPTTNVPGTMETGLTTVFGPMNYTEVNGWNTHNFSSNFFWDGTSNILIETCFNNTAWSANAEMSFSTTGHTSVQWQRQDAAGVCGFTTTQGTSNNRPNMQLEWLGNVAPIANFSVNTQSTCSGAVQFTDLSSFNPTSWLWNFGDGNTSTAQDPSHVYAASGNYDVQLIACNVNGCDTILFSNYINVALGGSSPLPASCTPNTTANCCGFGITNFQIGTINNSTSDGSVGYEDHTCISTNLTVGSSYNLTIATPTPQNHNAAAWIDYNNDGVLDDVTERVFTSNSALIHSGSITIPGTAVLNQPLRMRISADYDLQAPPTSCSDLDQGQAEDYTVTIVQNLNPPTPDFVVDDTLTCSGVVNFTDLTSDLPTSWFWDFGDGNNSNQQSPTHTYTVDGTYSVTLTAGNANGSNSITYTALITVNTAGNLTPANCTPSTLAFCCGYGITNVTLNTINHDTQDGVEGYQDYSCEQNTTIMEGFPYAISVRTGPSSPQDTKVWIDLNNDGTLDNNTELMFTALNQFDPNGTFTIPGGAVLNTPLRMRVMSDVVGVPTGPCDNQQRGQTEDYAVTIVPNSLPPAAGFLVDSVLTCAGTFNFTDTSLYAPTSWAWDFGDGIGTSTQQNPTYTYTTAGTYTVQMTATNVNGSNSATINVTYDPFACNVYNMPTTGLVTTDQCFGTLYDDGGPNQNYSNNTSGVFVINPVGAQSITLTFNSWDFVQSQAGDWLIVYDGPNTGSPIIGAYTGNAVPNGGTITSTGGSITLEQSTNFNITDPGFELDWSCVALPPVAAITPDSLVTCDGTTVFFDGSTNDPTSWAWDFGDGSGTSTLQSPTYTYSTAGNYTVTLIATNANGSDTTSVVITYDPQACIGPAPTAEFTSDVTVTCTGIVNFTDQSIDNPVNWLWDFGDSGSSSDQSPQHVYTVPGTYTVTLTASNGSGSDDEIKNAYITYDPALCDTTFIPGGGQSSTPDCSGVLMDNGGTEDYTNNVDGSMTISPMGATTVTVAFLTFDMAAGDTLYIYDGPDSNSPLIGAYSGTTLPNGGIVISSGGSLTLRQVTDATGVSSGYTANYTCVTGIADGLINQNSLTVYPNPADNAITINFACTEQCDDASLIITDAIGKVIYHRQQSVNTNFSTQVDVSDFADGVYFVSVRTPAGQTVQKVIIH